MCIAAKSNTDQSREHRCATIMKRTACMLICTSAIWILQAEAQKLLLKVNLGGDAVADYMGEKQIYDLDDDFAKQHSQVQIRNSDNQEIFQSQRFSRDQDFVLRIPVPDGVYSVTLLMAETFVPACQPGGRVFDISLGNPVSGIVKVVDSFDLFQNAGCQSAYGKKFDNIVSKEGIVVHLGHIKQHPALAGFIVEGFPVPKGDGSEYKTISQASGQNNNENELYKSESIGSAAQLRSVADAGAGASAPVGQDAMTQMVAGNPNLGQANILSLSGYPGATGVNFDNSAAYGASANAGLMGNTGGGFGFAPRAPSR